MRELMGCFWSESPVLRMRAADAVEKISSQKPDLLKPFKSELLGLLFETDQKELRWHLAQMIPRLPLTKKEWQRGRRVAGISERPQLDCKDVRSARTDGIGTNWHRSCYGNSGNS
jgi:hypothetical protein